MKLSGVTAILKCFVLTSCLLLHVVKLSKARFFRFFHHAAIQRKKHLGNSFYCQNQLFIASLIAYYIVSRHSGQLTSRCVNSGSGWHVRSKKRNQPDTTGGCVPWRFWNTQLMPKAACWLKANRQTNNTYVVKDPRPRSMLIIRRGILPSCWNSKHSKPKVLICSLTCFSPEGSQWGTNTCHAVNTAQKIGTLIQILFKLTDEDQSVCLGRDTDWRQFQLQCVISLLSLSSYSLLKW